MSGNKCISFVGDIAFFPFLPFYEIDPRKLGPSYAELMDCDLKMGNFEFPFSVEKEKYFINSHLGYLAPKIALKHLKYFKFDLLSLANNHILDWGLEGVSATIYELNRLGICTLGAGKDEQTARTPIIVEKDDLRFGFLAYCKKGQFCADGNKPGAALIDIKKIKIDITKLKENVDHVIVNLHWGVEFSDYPYPNDRMVAHSIIDYGASCIIGHHPHVVQGLEVYKSSPIFYSLGSFIYNPYHEKVQSNVKIEERLTSIGVKLYFNKQKIENWEILSFKNTRNCLFPKPLAKESVEFVKKFKVLCDRISTCEKWFYKTAIHNLAKRQIKTIFLLVCQTKGKFIFQLITGLKIRHLKILFGPFFAKFGTKK